MCQNNRPKRTEDRTRKAQLLLGASRRLDVQLDDRISLAVLILGVALVIARVRPSQVVDLQDENVHGALAHDPLLVLGLALQAAAVEGPEERGRRIGRQLALEQDPVLQLPNERLLDEGWRAQAAGHLARLLRVEVQRDGGVGLAKAVLGVQLVLARVLHRHVVDLQAGKVVAVTQVVAVYEVSACKVNF